MPVRSSTLWNCLLTGYIKRTLSLIGTGVICSQGGRIEACGLRSFRERFGHYVWILIRYRYSFIPIPYNGLCSSGSKPSMILNMGYLSPPTSLSSLLPSINILPAKKLFNKKQTSLIQSFQSIYPGCIPPLARPSPQIEQKSS